MKRGRNENVVVMNANKRVTAQCQACDHRSDLNVPSLIDRYGSYCP
jgi:transcription elongation factor Elf1